MKRTIKEVYDLIKEKKDNAERDYESKRVGKILLGEKALRIVLGNIQAYADVLHLIDSSHLLEDVFPVQCEIAEKDFNGKCLGFCHSLNDDEPIDKCKNCKNYTSYEEEPIKGSGLEAFNRFRDNIRWLQENTSLKTYFENDILHLGDDLDIIKKELKEKEWLERENEAHFNIIKSLEHENLENQKKLKAFEIIKRNPVMVISEFYKCAVELKMSYEEYCEYFSKEEKSIKTKEEYDLLREVLL